MSHTVDLLVLGAGIAGCSAALRAADLGASVVLVAKEGGGGTNASWAEGGLIGPGPPEGGDSPGPRAADIEAAGAGLCRPEAVRLLAEQGPKLCRSFLWERLGVPFDLGENGTPDPTAEAAHSARRIYHAKDATGLAIQSALSEAVRQHPNIQVREGLCLVDLITSPHHCLSPIRVYDPIRVHGAFLFDPATGEVEGALARRTLLATGGLGYLYLHTTNPPSATGDGLAGAHGASGRSVNCE